MKHWAQFTLKMMARLGLAGAVTAWLMSQTSLTCFTLIVARINVSAGVFGHGWVVGWSPRRSSELWWDVSGYPTDPATMRLHFDRVFPNQAHILPGVELLGGHPQGVLLVSHWFVCLTMLAVVIAISVWWRKRETSTETAVETTAVTAVETTTETEQL